MPHCITLFSCNSFRRLDLSNNKLRSLPAEIGDCVKLQELMLNNNYMRMLPYELGKLFQLVILGLKGNPLGPDILQMYAEPNGTKKLLEFMLDNLHGKTRVRVVTADLRSVSNYHHDFISRFEYFFVHESYSQFENFASMNLFTKYPAIFLHY